MIELGKQRPQFFRLQVLWDGLPLSTLADKKNGVLALLQPLIPDGMIEGVFSANLRDSGWPSLLTSVFRPVG